MVRKKNSYLAFKGGGVVKSKKKQKKRVKLRIKRKKNQKGGVLGVLAASIGVPLLTNIIEEVF